MQEGVAFQTLGHQMQIRKRNETLFNSAVAMDAVGGDGTHCT